MTTHFTRRAIASSLLLALAGCASRDPDRVRFALGGNRVLLGEALSSPELRLEVSPWAAAVSGATLAREQADLNSNLGPWSDSVVPSFVRAFEAALRARGIETVSMSGQARSSAPAASGTILIRTHLTAGFVYRTLTSSSHVPFVQAVLEASDPGGTVRYRQLHVATDRPFNPLMASLPANSSYVLSDLNLVRSERRPALAALSTLAAQLGARFAANLSA